jgi:hypothetical protein
MKLNNTETIKKPRFRRKNELSKNEKTRKLSTTSYIDTPFPFLNITEEKALKDFLTLKKTKIDKLTLATTGNKCSNLFFQKYRLQTSCRNRINFIEAWNTPSIQPKIVEKCIKIHKKQFEKELDLIINNSNLLVAMRYMYGSINQFKPQNACFIIDKFKPTHMLDPCSGWGDRGLACMSRDVNYTGIDTNKSLKTPYKKMIDFYSTHSKSKVDMYFQKSENFDFSKLKKYDMIFTSPPYYDLETYKGMPKYGSYELFIKNFLEPVITNSFKYLAKNGYMCLNIPHNLDSYLYGEGLSMYQVVKNIVGKETIKFPLPLHKFNRKYDKKADDAWNNTKTEEYNEYIYCWKK